MKPGVVEVKISDYKNWDYCFLLFFIFFFLSFSFFFNDTATTEIYTLSLHDALPISWNLKRDLLSALHAFCYSFFLWVNLKHEDLNGIGRSEEHTSELQSRQYFVCRLLLEKKNKKSKINNYISFFLPLAIQSCRWCYQHIRY